MEQPWGAAQPADSFVPASEGAPAYGGYEGHADAGGGRASSGDRRGGGPAESFVPESEGGGDYAPPESAAAAGASDWVSDTIDGGFSRVDGRGKRKAEEDADVADVDNVASSAPRLSEEQLRVSELVGKGENVFFTGSAGVGKSFMLGHIVELLRKRYGRDYEKCVAVCAPTGIAATHINGTTLHSVVGCGIPNTLVDFQKMLGEKSMKRWLELRVLIIDEISMVSAELFQMLERQVRHIREVLNTGGDLPFGGIQLILCGDFFQLPPIEKRPGANVPSDAFFNRGFAFQAPAWNRCRLHNIRLTKVFRQADEEFVSVLNDLREGRASNAFRLLQAKCMRELPPGMGIKPTELFARNKDVDTVNQREMARLQAPDGQEMYRSLDTVFSDAQKEAEARQAPLNFALSSKQERELEKNEFFRDCLASESVTLKVGAQVMLCKNKDLTGNGNSMLVNGSRGVVSGWATLEEVRKQLTQGKKNVAEGNFSSLDELRVILPADVFPQRVQWGPPPRVDAQRVMDEITKALTSIGDLTNARLPVVHFGNGRKALITPMEFSATIYKLGECRRRQIPLKPAWALTIHKCQGMTVDCAKVSLDNLFAEGAHREGHALRAPAPPRSRGLFLFVRGGDFLADTGAAVVSVGLRRASVRRAVPRALA